VVGVVLQRLSVVRVRLVEPEMLAGREVGVERTPRRGRICADLLILISRKVPSARRRACVARMIRQLARRTVANDLAPESRAVFAPMVSGSN
jgi:hypothetical protein